MMLASSYPNFKFLLRFSAFAFGMLYIGTDLFKCAHAAPLQIDRKARTIYFNNQPPNSKGDFKFEFQTTNGITTKAAGNEHGFSGVIQYISSEGIPVTMTYIADADGYHPSGDYVHPIPEYVLRSLDYIRTHKVVDEKKSRHF